MTTLNYSRATADVLAGIAASGGATVSVVAGVIAPTTGYAVATRGRERKVTADEDWASVIGEYARTHRAILARPAHYLGAWIADGVLYLDVSQVLHERAAAERLGRERSQLAVYALATGEEIATTS